VGVCALVLVAMLVSPGLDARPALAAARPRGGAATQVTLQPVDGGTDYYARHSPGLPTDPAFFPIAVWFESVTQSGDVEKDQAAGLNTYVQLTDNSELSLIRDAGMYALASPDLGTSAAMVGYMVSDEVDMRFGPGWGAVQPGGEDPKCATIDEDCGYSMQQNLLDALPRDNRLRYSNYGKGVTFWESSADARVFVNRFQDVVSADNYWFTDPNICSASEGGRLVGDGDHDLTTSQCRRAANYGATVDRLRSLVRPARSKPVWAFVELGHPFTESDAPTIRPAEVRAAVWSSLIHGARGIIYFNHSFGGDCPTQHALRERCYADVRAEVTATNRQVTQLAPVLNAPTAVDAVRVKGAADAMVKWSGDTYYVFAGSRADRDQHVTFTLPCTGDATATVLGENRTVPVQGGRFGDEFADANAVHLYRIDGGTTCVPR
jgi:hypothetical protein